jgi:hypothetical protein
MPCFRLIQGDHVPRRCRYIECHQSPRLPFSTPCNYNIAGLSETFYFSFVVSSIFLLWTGAQLLQQSYFLQSLSILFVRCDEVATDYSITFLLRFLCLSVVVGTDENWNFSAVWLGWNLVETSGWYPRLACMFWFQDLFGFYIVNKQNNRQTPKSRKSQFYKTCVFSAVPSPIDLKLGGDKYLKYYCLFTFRKHKQRKHTLWISRPSLLQMFW